MYSLLMKGLLVKEVFQLLFKLSYVVILVPMALCTLETVNYWILKVKPFTGLKSIKL